MLVRGQMAQRVERGDCVGAGRPQGEPTHVGLDQRRRRRSFPCSRNCPTEASKAKTTCSAASMRVAGSPGPHLSSTTRLPGFNSRSKSLTKCKRVGDALSVSLG